MDVRHKIRSHLSLKDLKRVAAVFYALSGARAELFKIMSISKRHKTRQILPKYRYSHHIRYEKKTWL